MPKPSTKSNDESNTNEVNKSSKSNGTVTEANKSSKSSSNATTEVSNEQFEHPEEGFIYCRNFIPERLVFVATEESKTTQNLNFPRYLYDKTKEPTKENKDKFSDILVWATKPIYMEYGGIPNEQYHTSPNAKSRAHFYIPYIPSDSNSADLFGMLKKLDNYMDTEINKKKNKNGILSLKTRKGSVPYTDLQYKKLVKMTKPSTKRNEDGEIVTSDAPQYEKVKIVFATLYDKEKVQKDRDTQQCGTITTELYLFGKNEKENTNTIPEIEKFFGWKGTASFALTLSKAWISKAPKEDTGLYECGLVIKCKIINVEKLPDKDTNKISKVKSNIFANNRTAPTLKQEEKEEPKHDKDEQPKRSNSQDKEEPKQTSKQDKDESKQTSKQDTKKNSKHNNNEDDSDSGSDSDENTDKDNKPDANDSDDSSTDSDSSSDSEQPKAPVKQEPAKVVNKIQGKKGK